MKLTKLHLIIILALALILCPILGVFCNSSVNRYNYSEGFEMPESQNSNPRSKPKNGNDSDSNSDSNSDSDNGNDNGNDNEYMTSGYDDPNFAPGY
jgi:hypothetical protein